MAVCGRGFLRYFESQRSILRRVVVARSNNNLQIIRTSGAGYLSKQSKHNDEDYEYEITSNPEEWKYVSRLLYAKTVPQVKAKDHYPSGWRPQSATAFEHPYYVKRTKNHMLPVYLRIYKRGEVRVTLVSNIFGDAWQLHDDLKKYLEEETKKYIYTSVHEGNLKILVKGDYVYYAEQFLLSKGF